MNSRDRWKKSGIRMPWESLSIESSWQVRQVASRPASYRIMMEKCIRREMEVTTALGRETVVDVLLPVEESLEELQQQMEQISRTNICYQMIFLEDRIDNQEVKAYLDQYVKDNPSSRVVHNERKIGIVSSLNRGLVLSRADFVVLLGAKVTLPPYWLERLVMPMTKDATVASVTPFTNHGLIAGFPVPNRRNRVFDDETVETTDQAFQKVRSLYTTVPYGVGFCMAMSREVIHKIGVLNQQNFQELDGADIDWALRAAQAGFRNVMAENLYVKNDRFSTDMLEGERMLSRKQEKIVKRRSPDYQKMIEQFEAEDPLAEIRAYAFSQIVVERSERRRIIFHQEGDPSADRYMRLYIDEKLRENEAVLSVQYSPETDLYLASLEYDSYRMNFSFTSLKEVLEMAQKLEARRIILGRLFGIPETGELLRAVRQYADNEGSRLVIMLLDYFSICPRSNMLDAKGRACTLAEGECEACLGKNAGGQNRILAWRQMWKDFLRDAQEILYYSDTLIRTMEPYFGVLEKVHKMEKPSAKLAPVERIRKRSSHINVLIPGPLTKSTGLDYVTELVRQAEKERIDMRFFVRGECQKRSLGKNVRITPSNGAFNVPAFMLKHDIDVCLIPDAVPDAIGRRTALFMEMNVPIAGRNMGETGYLLERYEKGLVLSDTVQKAMYQLKEHAEKWAPKKADHFERTVFVSEDSGCSGAVEGMEEMLWKHGVGTYRETVDSILLKPRSLAKYVVLDGIRYSRKVRMMLEERTRAGAMIWYLVLRSESPVKKNLEAFLPYLQGFLTETRKDQKYLKDMFPGVRVQRLNRQKPMHLQFLSKAIMDDQKGRDRWHLYAGSEGKKRPKDACVVGWMHSGGKGEGFTQYDCMEVISSIESVMEKEPAMRLLVSDRIMLDRARLQLRERMLPVDDVTEVDRLMLLSQCDVIIKPVVREEEPLSQSEELAEMADIPIIKASPGKIGYALEEFCQERRREISS